ncbi:hypothetical protein C4566_02930 [Candidatus Parcubacteria bacterium]|nr:MAG: hypothetical protein C4566_02930 [Candidatus Parcubacteria bacterium]
MESFSFPSNTWTFVRKKINSPFTFGSVLAYFFDYDRPAGKKFMTKCYQNFRSLSRILSRLIKKLPKKLYNLLILAKKQ